jgi:ketosteroid isomerase-like protein
MAGIAEQFLDAVGRRDWDGLAACFAPDARLRMLTPGPLREDEGPEAIAARFRSWFGDRDGFELREADTETVVDRVRVHYRAAGSGKVTDHTGYLAVEDGRIAWIVMTCSGFREDA